MPFCDRYGNHSDGCRKYAGCVVNTSDERYEISWNEQKSVVTLHQKIKIKNESYDNKKEFGKDDAHEHRYRS